MAGERRGRLSGSDARAKLRKVSSLKAHAVGKATASPTWCSLMARDGCHPLWKLGRNGKKRCKPLEAVTVAIQWSQWTGKAEAWTQQELPSTCWVPGAVPGAGGPFVSRAEPLASGSLCLVERGRQLTNTRDDVVFQMESVMSRELKQGERPGAPGAWGQGLSRFGNSQGRDLKEWRELCGWAELSTGQRWAQFEGQQKARAPEVEDESVRCRGWGAVGATRSHRAALWAVVRTAPSTPRQVRALESFEQRRGSVWPTS